MPHNSLKPHLNTVVICSSRKEGKLLKVKKKKRINLKFIRTIQPPFLRFGFVWSCLGLQGFRYSLHDHYF